MAQNVGSRARKSQTRLAADCRERLAQPYFGPEASSYSISEFSLHILVYTIEYGAPEIVDPYEKHKVVAGTAGVVISGIIAFAIIRSFGTIYICANHALCSCTPTKDSRSRMAKGCGRARQVGKHESDLQPRKAVLKSPLLCIVPLRGIDKPETTK